MKKSLLLIASSLVLLTACGSKGPTVESVPQSVQEITIPMPHKGEIAHPTGGLEKWFAITPMSGVGDTPANGVAQAHYFEKGLYLHTMQVNIAPAEAGYFYEAWVSDGTNTVSLGHLSNNFGDARHSIQFESDQDLRTYLSVKVTKQKDGTAAMGPIVAEGTLKDSTRQ